MPPIQSPQPLLPLPEDEDWRALRDPSRRTSALDAIKYVPLGANGDAYLSVGGELRTFYQSFANESFGQISGADNYILQRYLLHF